MNNMFKEVQFVQTPCETFDELGWPAKCDFIFILYDHYDCIKNSKFGYLLFHFINLNVGVISAWSWKKWPLFGIISILIN